LGLDGPASDAALVTRYARLNDHAAFAELLRRHGPVVLGVCRRVLGHADADDAFQAVFLVLARKAGCIRPPGSVGGWLYGVAVRTAKKAKVAAARRWRREMNRVLASPDRQVGGRSDHPGAYAPGSPEHEELRSVIDAELARLPDKLRLPVVLCDLGGKTRSEAARELGLPDGTVAARLHQARKLLADRLGRRGVALPAAGLGVLAAAEPVSADLARVTLAAAGAFAKGAASPAMSTTAQALAEGVVRAMNAGTWKLGLGAILAAGLLAGGGLMWAANGTGPAPPAAGGKGEVAKPEAKMTVDAPGYVTDVSFSTDGKQYAVVAGGKVTVHDAATGKVRWTAPGEAARFVHKPAHEVPIFDEKGLGRTITAPAQDALWVMGPTGVTIHAPDAGWDIGGGPGAPARPRPKTDKGWHVVRFSPDGKRYAAHFGFSVRVYDTATGFEPIRLADQHEPGSSALRPAGKDVFFSPDGKKVAGIGVLTGPGKMGTAVWDATTGERLYADEGSLNTGPATAAAIPPDGNSLALGHRDHVLIAGPVFNSTNRLPALVNVTALAFSPDGKVIAVGVRLPNHPTRLTEGQKTEVQLLDVATGKELRRLTGFADLPVSALAFSPDGKQLAVGTGYPNVTPIPPEAPKSGEVKVFALAPDPAPPKEPPANTDPTPVVERNQDPWVWRERPRPYPGNAGHITWADGVTFRPGGKEFSVVGGDGQGCEVLPFDTATLKGVPAGPGAVGGGPEIVGGTPKTIQALGVSYAFDGKPPAFHLGLAYSPDGKYVAVPQPGQIDVRDADIRWIRRVVRAEGARPTVAAFGPVTEVAGKKRYQLAFTDGRAVWSATWIGDGPAGMAMMGPMAGTAKLDGVVPAGVAFSPDGRRVVFTPNAKVQPGRPYTNPDPEKATQWYAQVWGGGSGEPMHMLRHGTEPITAVAWSPDGRIATADAAGLVVIWDGTTYKERNRVKLAGPVTALAFRADGKRFAAGVRLPATAGRPDGITQIEVRTEQDGSEPDNWTNLTTLGLSPAEVVRSVAFSPDGLVVIAGTATADGKGGGLRVWDRVKLAPKE
jgi:RNA polymerase sigma factor (sigma-70 family)